MLKKFVKGTTYVFIDAANISKSVEAIEYKVNYRKLRRFFEKQCRLKFIGFYTVAFEKKEHQDFLTALRAKRFTVISKPLKIIWDKRKSTNIHKANFDVEIAVDAIDWHENYNTIILFSGDSDFNYLIRRLKEKGKRAIVISTKNHIAKELVGSCDKYFDILSFKEFLIKKSPSFATGGKHSLATAK